MVRKISTMLLFRPWERRRYWRNGSIVDTEVWRAGRLLPGRPRRVPPMATMSDYCAVHRTRIFSDLACQFCGERPPLSVGIDGGTPPTGRGLPESA